MAGKGNTIPKDPEKRRHTTPRAAGVTEVAADDVVRGPDLTPGYEWPAPTRDWWDMWRRSPQSQTFTETDWMFLLDTALLHAELWSGNGAVAAELRLRVSKFGATPEDRMRLRLSIVEPEKPAVEPVRSRRDLKVVV